jgi:hypothetical protein
MYCPNKSSQEWKDLVDEVGEIEAFRSFLKYGEVRPPFVRKTLDKKNIAGLSKIFGEDLAKALITSYPKNKGRETFYIPTITDLKKWLIKDRKRAEKIITRAFEINPYLSKDAIKFFLSGIINEKNNTLYITKGFINSGSDILNYEAYQTKFAENYKFVQNLVAKYPGVFKIKDTSNPTTKVVEITQASPRLFPSEGAKRGQRDESIKEKYFPTDVEKSSVILKKIAESNHPLSKLAKHLTKYVAENDIDIELVDGELNVEWASGLYDSLENQKRCCL